MADSIYAPHNRDGDADRRHDEDDEEISLAPSNPFLTKPLLYISGIEKNISDQDIASKIFGKYLPVRLNIDRSADSGDDQLVKGTVEFQTLDTAEKAYATLRGAITLAITEDANDPKPAAKCRLVKQLPANTDDTMLFELFRPFGPLARAHCILTSPSGQYTGFRGMGQLDFYDETHAQNAEHEMHCAEVNGKTISVAIDTVSRRPAGQQEFSAAAAPFVPAGARSLNASAPSFQPPARTASGSQASIYASQAPTSPQPVNHQTAGPLYPVPGSNLQFSSSAGTYIDPCNLFIKNIDPAIDSNQLFTAFKTYGRIVSARIMRDSEGNSRGFGFVSFTQAEEASRALASTNNTLLGAQKINVRLHEPKRMRAEKLAAKFGADSSPDDPSKQLEKLTLGQSGSEPSAGNGATPEAPTSGGFLVPPSTKKAGDASSVLSTSPATGKERERLYNAIQGVTPAGVDVEAITDMLVSLPKKERALCLFNNELLRAKVEEAREILEMSDEDEGSATNGIGTASTVLAGAPATPADSTRAVKNAPVSAAAGSGSEAAPTTYTLSTLAALPAAEIVRLASSSAIAGGLPLPKADPSVIQETDAFVDGLAGKPVHDQKQKVGDVLHKKIKSFGFKGAPKLTIALLDSEDLRSLAHLMNSYPEVLREKVQLLVASK